MYSACRHVQYPLSSVYIPLSMSHSAFHVTVISHSGLLISNRKQRILHRFYPHATTQTPTELPPTWIHLPPIEQISDTTQRHLTPFRHSIKRFFVHRRIDELVDYDHLSHIFCTTSKPTQISLSFELSPPEQRPLPPPATR